jgi:phosphoglycerol transferase
VLVSTVALFIRNALVENPLVMTDECHYQLLSNSGVDRNLLLQRVPVFRLPNFLYLNLVSFHGALGANGYLAIRFVNGLVYALGLVPIYLLGGRLGLSSRLALLAAALCALLPTNIYTMYFMPEAFYFAAFWGFAYLFVTLRTSQNPCWAIPSGMLLAVLAGLKPHAFLVLLALLAVLTCEAILPCDAPLGRRVRLAAKEAAVLLLSFGVSFLVLRALLPLPYHTGASEGGFWAKWLGSYADHMIGFFQSLAEMRVLFQIRHVLKGHLMFLVPLFGLPLFYLLLGLGRKPASEQEFFTRRLTLLIVSVLTVLLFVVSKFSVDVHHLERIHQRYYDFILPGIVLGVFTLKNRIGKCPRVLIVAIVVAASVILLRNYWTYSRTLFSAAFIDAPWICGLTRPGALPVYAVLSMLAAFALAILYDGVFRRWAYLAIVGVTCLYGNAANLHFNQGNSDACARFRMGANLLHALTSPAERSDGVIITPDLFALNWLLFHFPAAPRYQLHDPRIEVDLATLPEDARWVYLTPGYRIRGNCLFAVEGETGTFVRRCGSAGAPLPGRKTALTAPAAWMLEGTAELHWEWGPGFSFLERGPGVETGPGRTHRWCDHQGVLLIHNQSARARTITLKATVRTAVEGTAHLRIDGPLFSEQITVSRECGCLCRTVEVPPGTHEIRFTCDAPRLVSATDPRWMVFHLADFSLQELGIPDE